MPLNNYEQARIIQHGLELDVDLAKTYHNIGMVYACQKDEVSYKIALVYYEQAREIQERLGRETHLVATLNNISRVYYRQGEYQRAKQTLELAIAIRKKLNKCDLESDLTFVTGDSRASFFERSSGIMSACLKNFFHTSSSFTTEAGDNVA